MKISKCWKIVEFLKRFTIPQTASGIKEVIQPADKSSYFSGKKNLRLEIYSNIQTFAFQVLREYISCASRNGAVQMFFLTQTRNMFARKFANWVRFFAVLLKNIFFDVEWVEVRKTSKVFWAKLYCKMSVLSCRFFVA